MKILFVHQYFPSQFKFLAPTLAADMRHTVVALTMRTDLPTNWQGIRVVPYRGKRNSQPEIHPWVRDFESKVIRGEACFRAALALRNEGFVPDVIIAHPGWGESLFLQDVWPTAKLGLYCEYFYHLQDSDIGFDPEFPVHDIEEQSPRLRLKNLSNILHFSSATAGISPTQWQADSFPQPFRSRIQVVHDGIDTRLLRPQPNIQLILNGKHVLRSEDEIITFVNRNLEPARGYHTFMRALPEILYARPHAKVLIIGGHDVSYGPRPSRGGSWKDIFIREIASSVRSTDWSRVMFLGHVPYQHFVSLLQLSTVHVYLTYPFVLSWSLLEAMSIGCAIVASDTSPVREVVKHGHNGRLVNFFDAHALAVEVCKLLDDAPTRTQMGTNARALVQEHYDLRDTCLPQQLLWVKDLMFM